MKKLVLLLSLVLGAFLVQSALAVPADPLVGVWTADTGVVFDVVDSGGTFRATRRTESKVGPCVLPAGGVSWEMTKLPDGTYKGTNFGRHWDDANDPTTCTELELEQTGTIGFAGGMAVLKVCWSASGDVASGCRTYTRKDDPPAPVPIATVSNGCGGAGWAAIEGAQNYLGNTSVYKNSNVNPLAKSYTVNFKKACDLHDAGYAGAVVKDAINGGTVDFRHWSRAKVDQKFLADMRTLCRRDIPRGAKVARKNCANRGGNFSFGALSRYRFVRTWGDNFFDANIYEPGTQSEGERINN